MIERFITNKKAAGVDPRLKMDKRVRVVVWMLYGCCMYEKRGFQKKAPLLSYCSLPF